VGLITDQLNLTGQNPLASANGVRAAQVESPFIPMAGAYSEYLNEFARAAAADAGVHLAEGVYAGLLGPTYETAAEVRMLHTLGADYVGCSTVCEAIMAKALGMQVLGVTLVTNKAGMIDNSREDALKAADKASESTQAVIKGVIKALGGK
jgi:purine-nucleoside phosphorylase